ncbi:MAG: DNA-3-methyladenine glycosylase II [Candidatus Pseudothioglobus sp.]|jgi:DNA-3-methyladenine glycosylase II|tara:strand:- start:878 stop:1501 length:624 start_codon:yes stop_codon:yes gene_type:complete
MKNPAYWQDSLQYLTSADKTLGDVISQHKDYSITARGEAYETLLRAIVGQQISVKAAASVWNKIIGLIKIIEPNKVLSTSKEKLKLCGLSKQKTQYILNISEHFKINNIIDDTYWENRTYLSVYEELITIKGIGPWTAEMFGMFYLLEKDIFPLKDVGILRAMYQLYNNGERIDIDKIVKISDTWKPYRSVACWFLWRSIDSEEVLY